MINKKRKGFTIVELVIVIAVIAVLAAVLIPTFSSVINTAKESAAMQEARNKYMEVYANDLEDGILNENVDESANLGYTYTTSNGTVIGFTYVKGGITVKFDGATNKWTVNDQIQGDNGGEGDNEQPQVHICGNGVLQPGQDATCTADGWKEYYKCSGCDKLYKEAACTNEITRDAWITGEGKIDTKTHTPEGDTWTSDDNYHWQLCSCEEVLNKGEHVYGDGTDTDCNTCGATRTVHTCGNGVLQPGQDATCTADGWKEYYKCSGCDKLYKEAACTNEITRDAWITGEGKIDTKTHTPEGDTWTSDDNYHWQLCSCEEVLNKGEHVYDDGRCTVCGVDDPEYLNKLGMVKRLDFNDYGNDGKFGNAIKLNDKQHTEDDHAGPGTASFTAAFWIKFDGALTSADPVLFTNKNWYSGGNPGYAFYVQNKGTPQLKFNAGNGEGWRTDLFFDLPTGYEGNWIHVICVVDRTKGTVRVAFNCGAFDEKQIGNYNAIYNAAQSYDAFGLYIGCDQRGLSIIEQDTYMDDFMYFNEALTEDDVKDLKAYYGI